MRSIPHSANHQPPIEKGKLGNLFFFKLHHSGAEMLELLKSKVHTYMRSKNRCVNFQRTPECYNFRKTSESCKEINRLLASHIQELRLMSSMKKVE